MMKHIVIMTSLAVFFLATAGTPLQAEKEKSPGGGNETDYCVSCHEAEGNQRLKKPVDEWRKSVHATLGKKCSLCHGGDPTVNDKVKAKSKLANFMGKPPKKTISEFCGRDGCHVLALEQFKRGPHYETVQKSGEPGCSSCHGAHNIQRSSIDIITVDSCVSCHPAEYSKNIISVIAGIDRHFTAIDGNVNFITEKQGEVKNLKERINNARHLFHQFVHVFSKQEMETTRKILDMEMQSLDSETRMKVASIRRLDVLYLAMLVFGLAIVGGISTYSIVMYGKRKKS
jgi:cytochrome c553